MTGELAAEGMFIAAAEPLRTLQVLSKSGDPFVRREYACYQQAFQSLCDQPVEDRRSYLEMAARQLGDDALADVWTRQSPSRRGRCLGCNGLSVTSAPRQSHATSLIQFSSR